MANTIPRLIPADLNPEKLGVNVLALDITQSVMGSDEYKVGASLSAARIMGMIQRAWKLDPKRAGECDLIFACCKIPDGRRQILGVFQFSYRLFSGNGIFTEGFFNVDCDEAYRFSFFAVPADDATWNRYTGLFLPARLRGEANPVRYYELTEP